MTLSGRKLVAIAVPAGCLMFAVGLLIGHYAIEKRSNDDDTDHGPERTDHLMDIACTRTNYHGHDGKYELYKNDYLKQCVADTCRKRDCGADDLPRHYIAYYLDGETINIDGKLDDPAWTKVPWSEDFVDMSGSSIPPRFQTMFKIRWDDETLYVGAYMQETDFWGSITNDEDLVSMENAFEMFVIPDGSMQNYKVHEINVIGATRDLMMKKAYMDKKWLVDDISDVDYRCTNNSVENATWSSIVDKATFTDGTINDPKSPKGTFWTAEWSFSFESLAEHTTKTYPTPKDDEVWFFNFARPEYGFRINRTTGQYTRSVSTPEYSSWQPVNSEWSPHIPSRFGLVQFKKSIQDKNFHFDRWHIYNALFAVFEAEHKFYSVNNMFTTDLTRLDLPPKLLSSDCVTINSGFSHKNYMYNKDRNVDDDFSITVKSNLYSGMPEGHIQTDRKVKFW